MTIIHFDDTKMHDLAYVRGVAADLDDWVQTFIAAAWKAERGVKAARKIETAVYRYSRFMRVYANARTIVVGTAARLSEASSLSGDHKRAAMAMSNSFGRVEKLVTGTRPWIAVSNLAGFKLTAASVLEDIAGDLTVAQLQCRRLQGHQPDERKSA